MSHTMHHTKFERDCCVGFDIRLTLPLQHTQTPKLAPQLVHHICDQENRGKMYNYKIQMSKLVRQLVEQSVAQFVAQNLPKYVT